MWCILTVYDIRISMDVEMAFLAVLFLGVVQSNTGLFGGTIMVDGGLKSEVKAWSCASEPFGGENKTLLA